MNKTEFNNILKKLTLSKPYTYEDLQHKSFMVPINKASEIKDPLESNTSIHLDQIGCCGYLANNRRVFYEFMPSMMNKLPNGMIEAWVEELNKLFTYKVEVKYFDKIEAVFKNDFDSIKLRENFGEKESDALMTYTSIFNKYVMKFFDLSIKLRKDRIDHYQNINLAIRRANKKYERILDTTIVPGIKDHKYPEYNDKTTKELFLELLENIDYVNYESVQRRVLISDKNITYASNKIQAFRNIEDNPQALHGTLINTVGMSSPLDACTAMPYSFCIGVNIEDTRILEKHDILFRSSSTSFPKNCIIDVSDCSANSFVAQYFSSEHSLNWKNRLFSKRMSDRQEYKYTEKLYNEMMDEMKGVEIKPLSKVSGWLFKAIPNKCTQLVPHTAIRLLWENPVVVKDYFYLKENSKHLDAHTLFRIAAYKQASSYGNLFRREDLESPLPIVNLEKSEDLIKKRIDKYTSNGPYVVDYYKKITSMYREKTVSANCGYRVETRLKKIEESL